MDNWKLGDDNIYNDNEKDFTIGKSNKDGDGDGEDLGPAFYKKSKVKDDKPKREGMNNGGSSYKRNSFKKIFYVILGIAAVISAYYIFKTFFPGDNLHVKLFGLKTKVFRSKVLPENNLVVTGYLLNENSFPISYVKLACRLYSAKNITLVTKHVYAGNFIDIKRLKNMSNVAINMRLNNKLGDNLSNMEILPNHPIKFMVVFFDIASNSKNYSITISHFYRIKK
ncbi:MAG: DUF3426 domain-containing protein [Deltaproteobacteria bacterium]|jgi:hypothetical protein|nr:DUF3426 domain-containing protein [Deltaproteobacteria bacterium]MCL5880597.1 DUF3426 domain-containing protein [Deltaproteobacteria bacterium]MDA8304892.1 DUF3426 domain-containing protein [Deltaproteobacteria bacterium]